MTLINIVTYFLIVSIATGYPQYKKQIKKNQIQNEKSPADYKFGYVVEDEKSGDYKSHKEERHGDQVRGEYSVLQPDGILHTVKYTVDKTSGFNAVISNTIDKKHVQKQKNQHQQQNQLNYEEEYDANQYVQGYKSSNDEEGGQTYEYQKPKYNQQEVYNGYVRDNYQQDE